MRFVMSKRVADVLVETLQAAGVKTCYGVVGDTLNRIAHAIDRSEIDWVHMRHEEAGAFAAGAEAQLTGRLTAVAGSGGRRSAAYRPSHSLRGLVRSRQSPLRQRALRGQSQPRARHPDRDPDRAAG